MNAINSKPYLEWHTKGQALFAPENRNPEFDRTVQLEDGYSVRFERYQGKIDEWQPHLFVNTLFDANGREVFTWHNLNGTCFAYLFRHANGKRYLLFSVDLYGYSVLELESGKEFHYIPSESYPKDDKDFDETFIWCGAAYDPQSNLLAVDGCIWAAQYSTIVLDFSDPLTEQPVQRWLDLHEMIDPDDRFFAIEYSRWENGMLYLDCEAGEGKTEEIHLSAEFLKEKMQ